MKLVLVFIILMGAFINVPAQFTFFSIEQRRFQHTKNGMEYTSTVRYKIEISFYLDEKYIILKNKDIGFESRYINVEESGKNAWRAYSKENQLSYLFTIMKTDSGTVVVIDDGSFATFVMVNRSSTRKS